MKISRTQFQLVIILLLAASCKSDNNEHQNEKSKDRNMHGYRIPRGLTVTTEGLSDGYAMVMMPNSVSTLLINRKGEVVHEWKGYFGNSWSSVYLMDDGSLVQNAEDPDYPVFFGGGSMGRLQRISWDSKTLWDFEYANEKEFAHHDIAVLPNGNVLTIAWESKTYDEALQAGRKPEMIPADGLWPDKIVEVVPDGKHGGKIVWEWHVFDHLIQDHDPAKANYGNPAEHPELLDFNVGELAPPQIANDSMETLRAKNKVHRNRTGGNRGADIYHFNAINYNADLDQIVFSSPHLSEVFIIDHSTTTKEAAGHTGGRWGKGGDFLYRWGNPQNYRRGDAASQKLFGQHDVRWIEKGKPGEGHLTVFNNDISGRKDSMNYSAIFEFAPPVDVKGVYVLQEGKTFGPDEPVWTYVAQDTLSFYSSYISSAHRMDNGNTFIFEGARGRSFEVTPEGKIVWEYLTQFRGELREPNGDPTDLMPRPYSGFRSTFIPANHPALAGKELKPLDPQPKIFALPPAEMEKK